MILFPVYKTGPSIRGLLRGQKKDLTTIMAFHILIIHFSSKLFCYNIRYILMNKNILL